MSRIVEITDTTKFVFKLLITSPRASPYVSRGFSTDQLVWVPQVDAEENGEFIYHVGAFRDRASLHAGISLRGIMRTNSEKDEGF
jgi:hypothetical protein